MSPPTDFWDRVAREVAKLMLDPTAGVAKTPSDYARMIRDLGGVGVTQPQYPSTMLACAGVSAMSKGI